MTYTYIDNNRRRVKEDTCFTYEIPHEKLMRDIILEIGFLEDSLNVFRLYDKGQIKYIEVAYEQVHGFMFSVKIRYLTDIAESDLSVFFIHGYELQEEIKYSRIDGAKMDKKEGSLSDLWEDILFDIRDCWKRISFKGDLI